MSNQVKELYGLHYERCAIDAVAAATASTTFPVFVAPFPCLVKSVGLTAGATITGVADTRHMNVINKGSAGAGATELGTKDYVSGTDAVANDRVSVYSSTTGTAMAEGDVLAVQSEKIGSGQAMPPFLVDISFSPNQSVSQ